MSHIAPRASRVTASFGAALASLAGSEAPASIVPLTASATSFSSYTPIALMSGGVSTPVGSFGVSAFVSIDPGESTSSFFGAFGSGSNHLDAIQWVGSAATGTVVPGSVGIGGAASGPGTQYFIFQEGGNVGWFSIHFVPSEGMFVAGAINNMGGSIRVGQLEDDPSSDVPLPASLPLAALATLALGAAGVRRRRAG